jgi:hypothetical protein
MAAASSWRGEGIAPRGRRFVKSGVTSFAMFLSFSSLVVDSDLKPTPQGGIAFAMIWRHKRTRQGEAGWQGAISPTLLTQAFHVSVGALQGGRARPYYIEFERQYPLISSQNARPGGRLHLGGLLQAQIRVPLVSSAAADETRESSTLHHPPVGNRPNPRSGNPDMGHPFSAAD